MSSGDKGKDGKSKEAAIAELQKQIREQRARIDPRVLKAAQSKASGGKSAGSVPYDREAAADAIDLFLKSRPDAEGFRKKLIDFMIKNSQ